VGIFSMLNVCSRRRSW